MHHLSKACNVKIRFFQCDGVHETLVLRHKKEKARLNSLKGNPPATFEKYHNRAFSNVAAINSCRKVFIQLLFASP